MKSLELPKLPYSEWKETFLTLHLILQIIGKTRLKLTPRKNHWWYITLYVTSRGFGTGSIPMNRGLDSLEISFDVSKKAIVFSSSSSEVRVVDLTLSPSVAQVYGEFMKILKEFGFQPDFDPKPFDLPVKEPFEKLKNLNSYQWEYIERFWRLMQWNRDVFQEFSGRFYGKTCPVHIYWHHLDLTVTRFSGKRLPPMEGEARTLEKDSYSHEQISFGFWAGDPQVQEPMYYAYTFPSPEGIDEEKLSPSSANWQDSNGSPMALLAYDAIREDEDPRQSVLDFLESAYQAGAKRAGWDIEGFRVPDLDQL